MKLSSEQKSEGMFSRHPAVGTVCSECGARVGKPCVSTVRALGFGVIGTPIEGVHAARVASALEEGVA